MDRRDPDPTVRQSPGPDVEPTRPLADGETPSDGDPGPLGPYRPVERIGRGGMGEVWIAEQTAPLRRRVAIKIIKQGMDSAEVVARFEAERQALALMDHPNVAHVFDAGTTSGGRPFFAMELVDGPPIDEYCDGHRLPIDARLDLFLYVCAGVGHAHQRAIIHRDLKCSNVLVTEVDGRPEPKVIDFGLVKAMGIRLADASIHTAHGQVVGTPTYMSPEQARLDVDAVDTRTDVYALGAILYKLLADTPPLDPSTLRGAGLETVLQSIREHETPRPSARVTSGPDPIAAIAKRRATDPRTLVRSLRGDLDWIVMKALEKSVERRFASVAELADDVRRYREHRPVIAGPPSRVYRIRKFARRHRTAVLVSATAALALVLFATGMGVQAERVRRQAAFTAQVADFMTGLFADFDPVGRGSTVTFDEVLDEGARRARAELGDQPLVQARMLTTIGGVKRNLDELDDAEPLLEDGLDIYRRQPEAAEADFGHALVELAILHRYRGSYAVAESLYRAGVAKIERAKGRDAVEVAEGLHGLAVLCRQLGRYPEAESIYRRILAIRRAKLGRDDPSVAKTLSDLGVAYHHQGRFQESLACALEALAIREASLPAGHAAQGESHNNIGAIYMAEDEPELALHHLQKALAIREAALGSEHTDVAQSRVNLGACLDALGRHGEAIEQLRESLRVVESSFGPEHAWNGIILGRLATAYRHVGDLNEARRCGERGVAILESAFGPDHQRVATGLEQLAEVQADLGSLAAADSGFTRAVALVEALFGADADATWAARERFAAMLDRTGRHERADSLRATMDPVVHP